MTKNPTFGVHHGLEVHKHTKDHAGDSLNTRFFVGITNFVGSPVCAYIFCVIALVSLPAVLTSALHMHVFPHWLVSIGLIALVAWIAQTFLQLVLLSVIMVGQNVSGKASDARSAKQFDDTERIVDLLDVHTQGGLNDVLKAVKDLGDRIER